MWISSIVELLRRVDQFLILEAKHGRLIEGLQAELQRLGERVARLEAREDLLIAEAKAAAAAAATQVSIASISDVARRIGRLEERTESRRLSRPESGNS